MDGIILKIAITSTTCEIIVSISAYSGILICRDAHQIGLLLFRTDKHPCFVYIYSSSNSKICNFVCIIFCRLAKPLPKEGELPGSCILSEIKKRINITEFRLNEKLGLQEQFFIDVTRLPKLAVVFNLRLTARNFDTIFNQQDST